MTPSPAPWCPDPADAIGFEQGLADAVNAVAGDPATAAAMGRSGRERAAAEFSWAAIAEQTLDVPVNPSVEKPPPVPLS